MSRLRMRSVSFAGLSINRTPPPAGVRRAGAQSSRAASAYVAGRFGQLLSLPSESKVDSGT